MGSIWVFCAAGRCCNCYFTVWHLQLKRAGFVFALAVKIAPFMSKLIFAILSPRICMYFFGLGQNGVTKPGHCGSIEIIAMISVHTLLPLQRRKGAAFIHDQTRPRIQGLCWGIGNKKEAGCSCPSKSVVELLVAWKLLGSACNWPNAHSPCSAAWAAVC